MSDQGKNRARRIRIWVVAFFLLGMVLQICSSPDPGIVQLELAFNHESATQILGTWGAEGQIEAVRNVKLDFLFIPGYVALLLLMIWSSMRQNGVWLYKFARALCLAPILAGALDVIENFLLLSILGHPDSFGEGTILAASLAATVKFSLIGFTLLALLVFAQRKATPDTSDDDLQWRFRAFVRQARDSSHESLFFLGLLHETNKEESSEAVRQYARFAIREVLSLHRRALVPEGVTPDDLDRLADDPDFDYPEILRHWQDLGNSIRGAQPQATGGPTFATTDAIREQVKEFLRVSSARFWWERYAVQWSRDTLRFLHKRLTFLLAAAVVAFVTLNMEAVNSLLMNQPFWSVVSVAWLLIPTGVRLLILGRFRGSETIPSWDVGGRPFRSFFYAATEPGRLVRRFPRAEPAETMERPTLGSKLMRATGAHRISSLLWILGKTQLIRVGLFLGWCAIGIVGFFFLAKQPDIIDSRLTAYLILSLFLVLLVAARTIDIWEFLDAAPVRLLMVATAAAAVVGLFWGMERHFYVPFFAAAVAYFLWYMKDRTRTFRLVLAIAFVVFAVFNLIGKNTQEQAHWTESTTAGAELERLTESEWPHGGPEDGPVVVMAASGGGSRAALVAGLTLKRLHIDNMEVAERLQAISSVSGGSLANAAFLARRLDGAGYDMLDVALSQDFILPTLWGFIAPGINRGDGIEMAWQGFERKEIPEHYFHMERYPCGTVPEGRTPERTTVALTNKCLSDLADAWREGLDGDQPRLPMPLFNTTTLDGHDVVISPLAKSLYTRRDLHETGWDVPPSNPRPTWVRNRDAIYGLEDLLPSFNPPLSSAVRASANFPFGFPLVRVRTEQPLFFSPIAEHHGEHVKDVYLTDGGALSNSGMFALFNLLMNKRDLLVERGVLLIIVDASKMPTYPSGGKGVNLYGTIGDQSPVGQYLHRRLFDLLAEAYGPMLSISQVDLIPEVDKNILTTWALSKKKREELIDQFLGEESTDTTTPCTPDNKSRWCKESRLIKKQFGALEAAALERQADLERWANLEAADQELLIDKAECSLAAPAREATACAVFGSSPDEVRALLTPQEKSMLVAVHSRFERLALEFGEELLAEKNLIERVRPPLD